MLHTIKNDRLTITVSEQGAELWSILDADGTEFLWQGDSRYWGDRALNIFPYVARLTEGQYELDGQRYHMPIHGLAMYEPFTLTGRSETTLVFTLTDTPELYRSYPRHFCFRVQYALRESCLEITYIVENRDEKMLYFGLGGHPGFNVPLTPKESFTDYRLRFSAPCAPRRIGFTEACFLDGTDAPFRLEDGRLLPLRHELFDQDAIVLKDMAREVTLESGHGPSVTVRYPDMPYLGIWHAPKTDAPYVCIEPWCSLPSTQDQIAILEKQPDLLHLSPGACYKTRWDIIIGKD